jgi:hypothetical protein
MGVMGVNYYFQPDDNSTCPHCGRGDKPPIHIGKSSFGWAFALHVERPGTIEDHVPSTLHEWYTLFEKGGRITNEYGDLISVRFMKEIITERPSESIRHNPRRIGGTDTYDLIPGEFS